MTNFVGPRAGTGHLRGPDETALNMREEDGVRTYFLEDRTLVNGSEVELRLRGRRGWIPARVAGLPDDLIVVWQADDGKELRASLSTGIGVRWA